MSYIAESQISRAYYHSTYLPYQTQHAAGVSSTQRPFSSGSSSAADPSTFDFPSGTTKYDCPWCDKSYGGPNGRSVWRRHAQEKHNLPCNSRRSRWDANPDRPKNSEDKKDRNLACKRQWAKDNRVKKKLLKQLTSISPSNPNRSKIEADLEEWSKRPRSESIEKENLERPHLQKSHSDSMPVFARSDAHSLSNTSYEYGSEHSGWSTVSDDSILHDSILPGLDAFRRALSEVPTAPPLSPDDDAADGLLSYYSHSSTSLPRQSPIASQPVLSNDDAMESDEEAEEMMQFVERYSSVEAGDDRLPEDLHSREASPTHNFTETLDAEAPSPHLPDYIETSANNAVVNSGSPPFDQPSSLDILLAPCPTAEHLVMRQAIWRREQEEAEDESKVEETLFTPAVNLDRNDYGFGPKHKPAVEPLSSPLRPTFDDPDRAASGSATGPASATPRLLKIGKTLDSPFHIQPVETTPDKRRLAWELGLGAESSPGSGFYRAQVMSAVAGRWVDEF